MNTKKHTGSYYTPAYLAEFITKRVIGSFLDNKLKVLEPSVGDGAFISELSKVTNKNILLTALDINEIELEKASLKWDNKESFIKINFLDFEVDEKFSLIVGNPPYIQKKLLKEEDLQKIKKVHFQEKLSENSVNNIWTSFLIKSVSLLKNNGIIAFVLPSELLQVKYAKEIRKYLINKFDRIEIFTFNDLMFECKGQDTIVFFGYLIHPEGGQYFANIESQQQLISGDFLLQKNDILIENDTKWSHHFLNEADLDFIIELRNRVNTIGYYADSKPGIVTAANNFFIINKEIEDKYNLKNYTYPIIQKGQFVNGSVLFDEEDFNILTKNNLPTKFLYIKDSDVISDKLREYIKIGEDLKLNKRYKCTLRNKWFVVPNVSTIPKAFFFKRAHLYPKLLKNNANAYVTDSAYKIEVKEGIEINSFIFSFYNSLTLLFAELEGRYYGGGVLELIPSEFKKLPLPYICISEEDFNNFVEDFEKKSSIEEVLSKYNYSILNRVLGLSNEEITRIESIRVKLLNKRTRK
ncbi:Eco57I restriction-modification methylase domain-containing protein [Elizabethkingia occulta]|uniref:Eco57I restriction-modification methylase domain-containing protein n=1 Tax=Elizabethkingia occulta TaxID=1867263 RepID=UPI00398C4E94